MTTKGPQARLPRFFFITELIRDKVIQVKADRKTELGRLVDLEIRLGRLYPEVVNLIVGRSFGRPPLEVPFSWVTSIDTRRTIVEIPPVKSCGSSTRSHRGFSSRT